MKRLLPTCFLISAFALVASDVCAQKDFLVGVQYQYGAALNTHHTNEKVWPPTDVSVPAVFFHLNAGEGKLGLRASVGWRREDVRFHIIDRFFLRQTNRGVEFKLQCTLPVSPSGTIALGMSPRILSKSTYLTEYKNELNNSFYDASVFKLVGYDGLNKLNASLSLSYYHNFAERWQLSIHIDHDMLTTHKDDLTTSFLFDQQALVPGKYINGRLTSLSMALGFIIIKQGT